MESQPLAYDIPTAATLCGIGRTKLLEEVGAGRLRTVKIGSRRLVPRQALEQYVAMLEEEAAARQ